MDGGRVMADTNVVSYLMKGTELGQRFKPYLAGKIVGIAFVTVAEMHYGAERANWGDKRRRDLEEHLKNFVVLPYNNDIAKD
jgi:predicted nucleic acid-binding protein